MRPKVLRPKKKKITPCPVAEERAKKENKERTRKAKKDVKKKEGISKAK